MTATITPLRRREEIEEDGVRIDLAAVRADVARFHSLAQPFLRRLAVVTYECGPAAHSQVVGLERLVDALLTKTSDDGDKAA